MAKKTGTYITLALVLALLTPQLAKLYTDYLWFDTQALSSAYWTTLSYQAGTFFAAAILVFATLYATLRWTEKRIKQYRKDYRRSAITTTVLAVTAVLTTTAYATRWDTVLRYANSYSFSATDPVFGKNIAFYIYQLPFYELLVAFATLLATLAFITAATLHILYRPKPEQPDVDEEVIGAPQTIGISDYVDHLKKHAYTQLSIIGAAYLLVAAAGHLLARYQLLYNTNGAVYGIGYAQAAVQLPALTILAVLSALAAAALLYNTKQKRDNTVVTAILVIAGAALLTTGATAAVQELIVGPDELNKEREHLAHEINATRAGFALDTITHQQLNVSEELTQQDLADHQPTIDNTRLWDDRPLLRTLNELQIFRSYYTFNTIDVDRYEVNGDDTLMMLGAREIDIRSLPPQSQGWVNTHMVYTHGYGAVMSPASKVTQGNLPELTIKDIPPQSNNEIQITQPRIYYGENTRDYAVVNTQTRELDYPTGEQNTYTHYNSTGGVQLENGLRRLAYAVTFAAPQILLSGSITDESRLQYARQVTQRAQKLAPFLQYDNDPYLVINEGKLYWIQDAYTTTEKYPYSRPITFNGQTTNYVRNSAKAVIDAYTGETTFYITDEQDPLIQTYQQAYPELFEELQQMPQGLQEHLRYPQDLFSAQGERYRDYHMQDPSVFYNKEDSWRVPNEIVRGREQPLKPYYQLMQLPGQAHAEFVQVQPFIPRGRENLIGWLAARSDTPNYGEVRAYHFSKQELTYGPMQVESRIDQDTEISQQLTLWSSSGSGVVRGNLLVIPIDDTILYVEPLFLESTEQGSLPQLMRVIAVHADRLAMAPTLEQALDAITQGQTPEAQVITAAPEQQPGLINDIRERYQQARQALQAGDFASYAQHIDALEELLENPTEDQPTQPSTN